MTVKTTQKPRQKPRQLSHERLLDYADIHNNKVWCFVAVYDGTLGVAVANESGYYPIHKNQYIAHDEKYDTASKEADRLNTALGLTDLQALDIVASFMFN